MQAQARAISPWTSMEIIRAFCIFSARLSIACRTPVMKTAWQLERKDAHPNSMLPEDVV